MKRDDYYSLTDIKKKYKISTAKARKFILDNNIPFEAKKIVYGSYYSLEAIYVRKNIFDQYVYKISAY